jgi:hypothetical protein
MCKKLVYPIFVVLLLSLALPGLVRAELVAWWRFDDGSGTTAADSSGNGNDATLQGGAQWVTGQLGGAIQFNGTNSYVAGPHIPFDSRSFTIAMWVNPVLYTNEQVIFAQHQSGATNLSIHFRLGGPNIGTGNVPPRGVRMGFYSNDVDTAGGLIQDNTWYHLTFWYDFPSQTQRIYVNGVQAAQEPATPYLGTSGETRIGQWNTSQWFRGIIDDVRIYNEPLSEAQILAAMRGSKYPTASRPDPRNGATLAETWVNLGWKAGDLAVSHDLYLGEIFEDVNTGAANTLQGNLASPFFLIGLGLPGDPYPGGLVPGTTYYWRVDEVNVADPNSPWKGDIWSFRVPPQKAYQPSPADGLQYQDPAVALSWTAGLKARLHTVYFRDNFDDANNATGGTFQSTITFTPAGPLAKGKTYYWRVDEFDGLKTYKGDVWSFSAMPDIPVTDPNLIGLWTFDEGAGAVAVDWSGHDNHGKLEGNPQWVDGYDGGALQFDGTGDLVNCGNLPALTITGNITVMCWIKVAAFSKTWETIISKGDNSYRMSRGPGTGNSIHFGANGPSGGNLSALTTVTTNTWRHVALVYDGANKIIYIDGAEDARVATAGAINVSTYSLYIGENSQARSRNLTGVVDDVRIYNKALMPADIQLLMRIDLKKAWSPRPVDGSTRDIESATPLTWSRGDNATQHAVYFGTDRDAVADANSSDTTGVYRGQQVAASYTPAEGVQWGGGPYYWRVDEINNDGTVTKGRVWSFKVADYLIVDDIESYNDIDPPNAGSNRVFDKWIDGFGTTTNGAVAGNNLPPYTERGNVHGGGQAMPLLYENNFKFSEATLTLTAGRDWTREGVANLSLWFRGAAANGAERMYVALNGTAVVYHTDPAAAQATAWIEWVIPLQQFAALGVNLTNVTSITIGFGTRGNTTVAGGTGQMYFDDIRLVRPATS